MTGHKSHDTKKDVEGSGKMMSYNMLNTCWPYGIHMAVQDRKEIASTDQESKVYKVDYLVQSSLSSSLVLTQYKVLSIDQP